MMKIFNTAIQGMVQAKAQADQAAERIVDRSTAPTITPAPAERPKLGQSIQPAPLMETALPQDIVDLKQAKISFAASAKLLKTQDEMLGRLLEEES